MRRSNKGCMLLMHWELEKRNIRFNRAKKQVGMEAATEFAFPALK